MKMVEKLINTAEGIAGAASVVYYLVVAILEKPSLSLLYIWLLLGGILGGKSLWCRNTRGKGKKALRVLFGAFDGAVCLGALSFFVFCFKMVPVMTETPGEEVEYLLVLGAKVNGSTPSQALEERIQTAYEYLNDHGDTKVITTGGKGKGEDITEGDCIARELRNRGIEAERILVENTSKTTIENAQNALQMLPEGTKTIAVVTNNFHLFRAKKIVEKQTEIQIEGLAAEYKRSSLFHYIFREYLSYTIKLLTGKL